MNPQGKALIRHGSQILIQSRGELCQTRTEFMESEAFLKATGMFLESLVARDSPLLEHLPSREPAFWVKLLGSLAEATLEDTALRIPQAVDFLTKEGRLVLRELVEEFYNHWRSFNRFMVLLSEPGPGALDRRPYRAFNSTLEILVDLIRGAYRDIHENICGDHPRIYRQVPAGCNVGLIAVPKACPLPQGLRELWSEVPFIRQIWIDPPMILDPASNTRSGRFDPVDRDPLEGYRPDPSEWLCYPAQVGPLVIFAAFHVSQIGLGCALANLFELATDAQIARGPDAMFAYGVPMEHLRAWEGNPTVFHEHASGLLTAAIPSGDAYAYFGYLKKMALTLHNVAMLRKGRLPFHGALVDITLDKGRSARVLIIGDTATGKSESIEAFRTLAGKRVRALTVVADDMGSLELTPDGRILGYGTETGAFVRLDDLHRGYAFGQIDRAIFMSPHKVNARVVIPVTTLDEVLTPHPVDFILYANNFEEGDVLERFDSAEAALATFSAGRAMGKGTTTATGLTESYFANPFGAPQCREAHEALAERIFRAAFKAGIFVGQIRTRLAMAGWETKGPAAVAEALLESLG
jgi:hypothetical protein